MHPRAVVPPALLATAGRQAGLFSLHQARRAGLTCQGLRGLVERRAVRRVARAVHEVRALAPEASDWDARRRYVAWLGLLTFGPDAVAVGPCALALHGVEGLPATITPHVALPRASNRRDRDGARLRQFDHGMRTVDHAGRRVATLEWAVAQAVPELPRAHGLAVLDCVLRRRLLTRRELDRSHDLARGRRGVAARHDLWELADPRAESPLESYARLECIDEGVPPDRLQLPVHGPGGVLVARGDMAWRRRDGRWLVAELDGRDVHEAPAAVFADRVRQNVLTGSGAVDLLRFTSRDRGRIAATVRRALAS